MSKAEKQEPKAPSTITVFMVDVIDGTHLCAYEIDRAKLDATDLYQLHQMQPFVNSGISDQPAVMDFIRGVNDRLRDKVQIGEDRTDGHEYKDGLTLYMLPNFTDGDDDAETIKRVMADKVQTQEIKRESVLIYWYDNTNQDGNAYVYDKALFSADELKELAGFQEFVNSDAPAEDRERIKELLYSKVFTDVSGAVTTFLAPTLQFVMPILD